MGLCENCENHFWYKIENNVNTFSDGCIFKNDILPSVRECSHFKPKPKEKKFGEGKIEKAVDKKGQNIEYGLCSCGEQLLTKEELKKGKCDICLEKIRSLGI